MAPSMIAPRLLSWASILEDQARQQATATAALPWVSPHLALMPDAHWGKGSTVGSVIPTEDVVMPAAVGVDIGCGMAAVRTQLTAQDLARRTPLATQHLEGHNLGDLRLAIQREVPVGGKGSYREITTSSAMERAGELLAHAERQGVDPEGYAGNWPLQLGTLGGGNHFIELCLDEENRVWVFLHSGSRGVGNRIAQRWVKTAQQLCAPWHVQLPHPDLAFLPQGTDEFWAYLRDLRWAQAFALANRAEMVDRVVACLGEWMGEGIQREELINCHHNYTTEERHYGRKLWITRKGAIRAGAGDLGLIPGSMGTRSYVVEGLGNRSAFDSAPHGAGRNFSRTEARRRFSAADLATAMVGIEWRADEAGSLVDEIPAAYKDVDVVMADAADLVKVRHTLRQILNVKGVD